MPSRRLARELALQVFYGRRDRTRAERKVRWSGRTGEGAEDRAFVRDALGARWTMPRKADRSCPAAGRLDDGTSADHRPIAAAHERLRARAFDPKRPARAINEAVELAKRFSTEDSGRFVNGVLAKVKPMRLRWRAASVPKPAVSGRRAVLRPHDFWSCSFALCSVVGLLPVSSPRTRATFPPSTAWPIISRRARPAFTRATARCWPPLSKRIASGSDRTNPRVRPRRVHRDRRPQFLSPSRRGFRRHRARRIRRCHHEQFQGASTITQQFARQLFLNDQVSISRKVQEALLAIQIERYYTKDEILERYLNIIYFGAGAYGMEPRRTPTLGRSVGQLTIGQAAMLAGMSPRLRIIRRLRIYTLARTASAMCSSGWSRAALSPRTADADAARRAPQTHGDRPPACKDTLSVLHDVRDPATRSAQFGSNAAYEAGLQVYTTLDPRMQSWGKRP